MKMGGDFNHGNVKNDGNQSNGTVTKIHNQK